MAALRKLEIEIPARQGVLPRPPLGSVIPGFDGLMFLIVVAISGFQPAVIVLSLLTFMILHLDRSRAYRLDPKVGQEMSWLLGHIAVPLFAVASIVALGALPWLGTARELDRLVIAGSLGAVLVIFGRAVAYAIGRGARARGLVSERTVIVGSGELGVELADALTRHPEYGLEPVGFVDGPTTADLPLPLLGGTNALASVVREFGVRRLLVAFGRGSDRDLTFLLRELETLPIEVYIVPRFYELGSIPAGAADTVVGIPLVHIRRPAMRASARLTKRAFDMVVGSTLLILTSPVLLLAAAAVRLSSSGPVLFRQPRVGRNGRTFEMLKFRTLYIDACSDTAWSVRDEQVTSVGRVLRRTSVDELPQLINVVRGDMSLVGPRPEQPYFVERFGSSYPGYVDRFRVWMGMTGLGQVNGNRGPESSIKERVRFDNLYIDTWSLWGDILIMLRTVRLLLSGDAGSVNRSQVPSRDDTSAGLHLIDLTQAEIEEPAEVEADRFRRDDDGERVREGR